MKKIKLGILSVLAVGVALSTTACDDDGDKDASFADASILCETVTHGPCFEVKNSTELMNLVNVDGAADDVTVILGAGTYRFDSELTLPSGKKGFALLGQGREKTTLDFSAASGGNGILGITMDDIWLQGFTVIDSAKDGIRVEDSNGVTFRDIGATWSNEGDSANGAYGIYPVRVQNVLVEDSVASNASDAGLYVGQCQTAIVRNNVVRGNVAGLEIENTQYAEVYDNHAEDNTGGIVVFDLPGNPIFGHDIKVFNNTVINNNRANFAPSGIVGEIPAGTGTFAMASRRVHIYDNTYKNNQTVDIALLDGTLGDQDSTKSEDWAIARDRMVGDYIGQGYDACYYDDETKTTFTCSTDPDDDGANADYLSNWRTYEILVGENSYENSGKNVDTDSLFGKFIQITFEDDEAVPNVIYAREENLKEGDDLRAPEDFTNENHICVGALPDNAVFTVATVLSGQRVLFSPDSLYAFDCDALNAGPIEEVVVDGARE